MLAGLCPDSHDYERHDDYVRASEDIEAVSAGLEMIVEGADLAALAICDPAVARAAWSDVPDPMLTHAQAVSPVILAPASRRAAVPELEDDLAGEVRSPV